MNNELTRRPRPVVSVLVPVFNAGQLVGRAVDSILAQTLTNFELIVIDDGSTDETSAELTDRAGDPRLRVVTHDGNHGLVTSLNEGLALCRGELVARLDADDWSSPTRLARQVAVFRARPQVVLCASAYDRVDPAGRLIRRGVPPATHAAFAMAMLTGNRALHSTVMFRRDAVREVGGYLDSWFPVEDYDLWLRLLEVGEFEALKTSETTYMTERSDSISSRWSDDQCEQSWRRSQRYFEELVGERPSDVGNYRLRVCDVSRASRALRRRLERRGIPTTGLDRQGLIVANWMLREQSRLRRALTILVVAPRLAIGGRLTH